MSFLAKIFSAGVGDFADKIGGVVDRFVSTPDEKAQFILEMETLLQKRDSEIESTIQKELDTAARVIEAELNQDDRYTKRARPTIIYTGLCMYVLNSILFPKLAIFAALIADPATQAMVVSAMQPVIIPDSFALAWGSVVAIYAGGRTLEKRGARSAGVQMATGNGNGILAMLKKD